MRRFCSNCGTLFDAAGVNHRYCGAACAKASVPKGHFIIFERDRFQCGYCGRSPLRDRSLLSVDHVIPVSAGGDDRAINLLTCCRTCNSQKAGRVFGGELRRQVFAAIHDRNVATGIDDNQQIELGSIGADLRHDLEALSMDELKVLIDAGPMLGAGYPGKLDPIHWLLAIAQRGRLIAADAATDPRYDAAKLMQVHEEISAAMTEIENRRYMVDDPDPAFTEPLFDLRSIGPQQP